MERTTACGKDSYSLHGPETAAALGLRYPDLHMKAESIAALAIALAERENHRFCRMPFCSTVEAEAFGADITLGDARSGPRAGAYGYATLSALEEGLGALDLEHGRIAQVQAACRLATERGWPVIVELSGPLGILNCLVDFTQVLKVWRKDEARITALFGRFTKECTRYALALQSAGAAVLSLADPMANVNILGPRFAADYSERFLLPLMREVRGMEPHLAGSLLHLCPKLATPMIDQGQVCRHPLQTTHPLSYDEILAQAAGRESFMGALCIHRLGHLVQAGEDFSLRLSSSDPPALTRQSR